MIEPAFASVEALGPDLPAVPAETQRNRRGGGWQRHLWTLHACGFALLIAGLAAVVATALRSGEADAWVAHTLETRQATETLLGTVLDAEAKVRTYLLTRDPASMPNVDQARTAVSGAETRLHDLVADNPAQLAHLSSLVPLITQRLALLGATVAVAHDGDEQALNQRIERRDGAAVMARIRDQLVAFDQAEAELLVHRQYSARLARRQLLFGTGAALTLALLLGALTARLSHRQATGLREANIRLAGTVSDQTDALRNSERRFRQVFHDSPIGLSISTAQTRRIIAANPALCRMLGYGEAELLGRTGGELAYPDDVDLVVPVNPDPGGPWQPIEKRYVTKSGTVMFARAAAVPLALPSEDEPLVLDTMEDISREKATETALRDSEERLRLAVEAAGLGVWEQDWRRGVARLDARAAELAGGILPALVWLAETGPELAAWKALLHPDDAASYAATEADLRDGSRDQANRECRVRCPESSWVWLSCFSTVTERDPDTGRALRAMTILQDITLRRETEMELRHAHRLEAVGQLTGGVAHDFNNLLGAILGHTEFLLDLLTERTEARELATEILDCALNGAALTQRLLAFARRQPLQPAVIDLNEYLPVHVSLLQRTLGETVTVDVALGPDLWLVHADPSQIVDVLLNLAINARDAMPHGGRLSVATTNITLDAAFCSRNPEASPGEHVMLSVADTGIGMSPEVLARAVEPFFTTKPPGKGSGLGLSTIYGFARQSGGYLDIESEPGKGTIVRLYLPRTQADRSTGLERQVRAPPLPRGKESILVVDDNDAMRTTAARNLAALGYHVRLASDGPSALAILQAGERFDLLFTDMVMPHGLSGYQLAEAARLLQPDLQVLFTTGFAPEDDTETGVMEAGALRKPYRRRELAEKVRAMMQKG
ncbi:MAG TPA: CHASE3 domain-containing protein [Acetobacteraceae bacterium]|nr:CHASE3 domain-containing protein [Acetobacteraceae bacterium]